MSKISVNVNNMNIDWQTKTQSGVKIVGSVLIDDRKEINFSFYKDCLNTLLTIEDKVIPELTKDIKTTIKNLISAYAAGARFEGWFEVSIEDNDYSNSCCALEE